MKTFQNLSKEQLDRLFSGKVPAANGDLAEVAAFVQEVKAAYLVEPDPSVEASHLASVMNLLAPVDEAQLAAKPVSEESGNERRVFGLAKWRKAVPAGLFASFAMKLLGGTVALAATTGGLAAAGALPSAVQTPVADAIGAATGWKLPGATQEAKSRQDQDKDQTTEDSAEVTEPASDPAANDFGQFVSAEAKLCSETKVKEAESSGDEVTEQEVAEVSKTCGVDGQVISQMARERAEARRAEHHPAGPGRSDKAPVGPPDAPGAPEGAGRPEDAGPPKNHPETGVAKEHVPPDVPSGRPSDLPIRR